MGTELAVQNHEPSVMQILSAAVMKGDVSIEVVERLSKLASEYRDYDAKVEFDKAMQRAQSQMRRIGADAVNPQTRSKYATYAKLDGALRPIYSAEGFAVSFNTADCPTADMARVIAYVSHEAGHTRTYQIDMPSDGKGAKGGDVMTKTHATGAAMSYGQRYLLKMIFNVAVGETDDDGNLDARTTKVPEPELVALIDNIKSCSTKEDVVSIFQASYKHVADTYGDKSAMDELIAVKNKRKAELS